MTPHEQIQANILQLREAMLSAYPEIPTLLQTIHRQLKEDPEVTTLLTEGEIATIVDGLKRQKSTELVTKTSSAAKTSRIKNTTVDDLFG